MSERLSVAEQLARKREYVAQLRAETYSAENVVNAYARCFYAAISSELLSSRLEFEDARAQDIHPRHTALLYNVSFSDIEGFVYDWAEANIGAALEVALKMPGLPALTASPERETTYNSDHMSHVQKIHPLVKRVGSNPFAIQQVANVIEMIYTLLEIFNHSGQLSRREQEYMPANLALLATELSEELTCLRLPQLAPHVSYGDVREGASTRHTGEVRYSKALWAQDLTTAGK